MAIGAAGDPGLDALYRVVRAIKSGPANAMTQHLSMVASTVMECW